MKSEKEVWLPVKGYESYYKVSNFGNIMSVKRNKLLKPTENSNGYLVVNIRRGNQRKVHQLVAEAFLNHTPNGHKIVVDHIDNDKLNNRASNLQIISHRRNLKKDRKKDSSRFIGVSFNNSSKKWVARVYFNRKNVYLGSFKCELKASIAVTNFFKLKNIDY